MSEGTVVKSRRETPEEQNLREWFAKQRLENLTTLETAARQVIQLVMILFGTMFGVLSLGSASFNNMLADMTMKRLGTGTLAVWVIALLCALVVTTPLPYSVSDGLPNSESTAFRRMQSLKKWAFYISTFAFGIGAVSFAVFIGTLIMMRQPLPTP